MKNSRFPVMLFLACLLMMAGCQRPSETGVMPDTTQLNLSVENETGWDLKVYRDTSFKGKITSNSQTITLNDLTKSEIIYLRFYEANSDLAVKVVKLVFGGSVKIDLKLFFNEVSFKDDSISVCLIEDWQAVGWEHWFTEVCGDGNILCDTTNIFSTKARIRTGKRDNWNLKFKVRNSSKEPNIGITGVYDPTIKTIIIDDL